MCCDKQNLQEDIIVLVPWEYDGFEKKVGPTLLPLYVFILFYSMLIIVFNVIIHV